MVWRAQMSPYYTRFWVVYLLVRAFWVLQYLSIARSGFFPAMANLSSHHLLPSPRRQAILYFSATSHGRRRSKADGLGSCTKLEFPSRRQDTTMWKSSAGRIDNHVMHICNNQITACSRNTSAHARRLLMATSTYGPL